MKLLHTVFEALLVIGAGLAALLAVVFGLQIAQMPHTVENGKAIDEAFRVSAAFIDQFHEKNGRVPSQAEFSAWKNEGPSHIHGTQNIELIAPEQIPEHLVRQFGPGSSERYALSVWRGEWNEYYAPWVQASTVDRPLGLYTSSIGLCLAFVVVSAVLWRFARRVRMKNVKPSQRSPA